MKRSLGENQKGKGNEKVVEDEDVDLAASWPTRADSDDPVPYLAPFDRPMSTLGWPSVFILSIFDGQWIGGVEGPEYCPGYASSWTFTSRHRVQGARHACDTREGEHPIVVARTM